MKHPDPGSIHSRPVHSELTHSELTRSESTGSEQTVTPLNRELQDYLDQLLQEVSSDMLAAPPASEAGTQWGGGEYRPRERRRSEPPVELRYAEPQPRFAPRLPPVAPPVPEPGPEVAEVAVAEPPAGVTVVPDLEESRTATRQDSATLPAAAAEAAQPVWRDAAFEALLFRAGGLTLAVPLTLLGAIRPLDEMPTPLFGQARWSMGLLRDKEGTLRVVDTAQVIMAERYRVEMRAAYRYVISLHGSDWALAVDEICNAVTLQPGQVRWRSRNGKRPWLAGTVVEHMCALLDVAGLDAAFRQK